MDYQAEREESLYNESLNQGEHFAQQCRQFGNHEGAQQPERAWLTTNYDTQVPNPHYKGAKAPHPEEYPVCPVDYAEYFKQEGWDTKDSGCECKECDPVGWAQADAEYSTDPDVDDCPF